MGVSFFTFRGSDNFAEALYFLALVLRVFILNCHIGQGLKLLVGETVSLLQNDAASVRLRHRIRESGN
jgi:hypothetical protein